MIDDDRDRPKGTDFVDDRPIQQQLISDSPRADTETRYETGSDEFSDDRERLEAPDAGDQSTIVEVERENQRTLTGETAVEQPEWEENDG